MEYLYNLETSDYLLIALVLFCLFVALFDSIDTKRFLKSIADKYGSNAPSILNKDAKSNIGITRK